MPGKAYRLYTEESFASLPLKSEPEIQRSELSAIILQLKVLNRKKKIVFKVFCEWNLSQMYFFIVSFNLVFCEWKLLLISKMFFLFQVLHVSDVVHFDFMSAPPAASVARALELLYCLGAIDSNNNLTQIGGENLQFHCFFLSLSVVSITGIMAELPLEVSLSRMLIAAGEMSCSEEMLSIVAMLSVQDPFVSPLGKTKSVDAARRSFAVVRIFFVFFSFLCKFFFERSKEITLRCSTFSIRF